MIGHRIASTSGHSIGMATAWLVAMVLAGIGIFFSPHWAMIAALPAMLALALWWGRGADFECDVTADGLLLVGDDQKIAFADIESVSIEGKPYSPDDRKFKPGKVFIVHRAGQVVIPQNLTVPVQEFYRFLLAQVPSSTSHGSAGKLDEFLSDQRQRFGEDRVFVFAARGKIRPKAPKRIVAILTFLLTGAIWLTAAIVILATENHHSLKADDFAPWIAFGIIAICIGLICMATFEMQANIGRRIPNWQQSSLVVSPGGVALAQGKLTGVLRWDELLDINLHGARSFGQQGAAPGILLKVAGANILIEDIYNRPLPNIEPLIRKYWRPDAQAGS